MELIAGLYTRRSVRQFTGQAVERDQVLEIIKAGTWAPSGRNNQPWRFVVVQGADARTALAKLTKYHSVIEGAPVCIAVFVDKAAMYNDVKDHQAMGACIQNMLLAAHALGLGAVWLGEILKNGEGVRTLLGLSADLDLMAVVALGHPVATGQTSTRKAVADVVIKEL